MCPEKIIELFLVFVALAFVTFEVYLSQTGTDEKSSNILIFEAVQKRLLFIPFAIGAITGHLFLGTESDNVINEENFGKNAEFYVVGIIFGISLLLSLFSKIIKTRSRFFLSFLLFAGILYGHYFWSMKKKNYTKSNHTCHSLIHSEFIETKKA